MTTTSSLYDSYDVYTSFNNHGDGDNNMEDSIDDGEDNDDE